MSERYAFAYPLEAEIKSDGSGNAIFRVVASDKEMATSTMLELDELVGTKSREISPEEYEKRSAFGFSASGWKMCNWEPQGPKKNWIIKPPDPRSN